MEQQEIKKRILQLEVKLENLINPTQFTLNKEVDLILTEIENLRNICNHNFVNNKCEFCGREK